MNFKDVLEKNKQEYLNRLIDLLKINSILDESTSSEETPFGKGINDCLEHFIGMAKKDGFDTLNELYLYLANMFSDVENGEVAKTLYEPFFTAYEGGIRHE